MDAVARELDWTTIPEAVRPFAKPGQTFVTPGRAYAVLAVSLYKDVTFLLVVDDTGEPGFVPAWCFAVRSTEVPAGWICNVGLGEGVDLVLGPPIVARDLSAYSAVVDHEPDVMDALRAMAPSRWKGDTLLERVAEETRDRLVAHIRENTAEDDARREAERDTRVKAALEKLTREGNRPPPLKKDG